MESGRPERIYLRIPILVRRPDPEGHWLTLTTFTTNISRTGARIAVPSPPADGTELEITNLSNDLRATAKIAHRWPERDDGLTELGVTLTNFPEDFWGVEFEERLPSDQMLIAGLLICLSCRRRVFGYLPVPQYRSLGESFTVERLCSQCQANTSWTIGFADEDLPETPPSSVAHTGRAEQPASQGRTIERRGAVRYVLKVPLLVTGRTSPPEQTVAEDLSRTGLMFSCSGKLEIGETIQVIIGYGVTESPAVRPCKVIRRTPQRSGSSRFNYGVMFQTFE